MLTREKQDGIAMNLDQCIAFSASILGNQRATNGDRCLAALTIAIASIGSAYVQSLEISHIMTAGEELVMARSKIYIPNKSSHDFTPALDHGEPLIYLTEGRVNHFKMNTLFREIEENFLKTNVQPEDFIVQTSLISLNALCCSIFAARFHRLNLLIFNSRRRCYYPYHLMLNGGPNGS